MGKAEYKSAEHTAKEKKWVFFFVCFVFKIKFKHGKKKLMYRIVRNITMVKCLKVESYCNTNLHSISFSFQ